MNNPLISPNANAGGDPRSSGHLRPRVDRGFGLACSRISGSLRSRGLASFTMGASKGGAGDRLGFCEAGFGSRDVNADGPSLPGCIPGWEDPFCKRMLLFCKPWVSVNGPPELLVSVLTKALGGGGMLGWWLPSPMGLKVKRDPKRGRWLPRGR